MEYTIIVSDGAVIVVEGKEPKSKLKFWCDGLRIYIKGAVKLSRRDVVSYHAFDICQQNHIPARLLRSEGWV